MKRRLIEWLLARLGVRWGYIDFQSGTTLITGPLRISGFDIRIVGTPDNDRLAQIWTVPVRGSGTGVNWDAPQI